MSITIQNTYLTDYVQGFPGMLADGATQNRVSRTVEDVAGIGFGKAVFQGAGDHGVTATPGTKFKGIVIADIGIVVPVGGAVDTIPQLGTASLLDQGDIWVTAGANTTAGAVAYVTSGGVITPTATSNTAIPATFLDTVSSGAPARIRVVQQ